MYEILSLIFFYLKNSNNHQSQFNELIEATAVSNNLNNSNSNNDKNYKFLEILNNNFNYAQEKGLFKNFQIHLTKNEIQFNLKENNDLKESSTQKNELTYCLIQN